MANISMANWREKSKSEVKRSTHSEQAPVESLPQENTNTTIKGFNNPLAQELLRKEVKDMEDFKFVIDKEDYFYYLICDDILWNPKLVLYYEGVENVQVLTTRNLKNEVSQGLPTDDILSKYSTLCVIDLVVKPSKKLDGSCYYLLCSNVKSIINIFMLVGYTQYNQIYYDCDTFKDYKEFEDLYSWLSKIDVKGLFLVLREDVISEDWLKGKDRVGWLYGFENGVEYSDYRCTNKLFLGWSSEEAKSKLDDMYDSDYLKGNKIIIDRDGNLREFK